MYGVNNFRLGSITPQDYYLGSTPIQKMYLGQVLVFDRTEPIQEEVRYTLAITSSNPVELSATDKSTTIVIQTYKETYLNGEAQGDRTLCGVGGVTPSVDWIDVTGQETIVTGLEYTYSFEENIGSARSTTLHITQTKSGKSVDVVINQAAGTIDTKYTLNVQPTEDTLTGADDDNSTTFTVNTYKQQVINGTVQSAKTHVTCNFDSHNSNESAVILNSTNNNNGTYTGTVTCNTSSTNKDYPITITQSESNKTATFTLHKVDPTIAYGDITITSFTYPVASASGETLTPTVTYSQTYGYNGATTGGGTITSGATVTYSGTFVDASTGKIIIPNKGTTVSGETTVSEVTVHVSMNGKTASETFTVKQEANTVTYGEVTGGTATANDILASGGTVQATVTKDATQTVSYTSGSTRSGNITTSATEVSASSLGTTTKDRTQVGTSVLTFTGEGGKTQKVTVAVYQQANTIANTTYKDAQILLEADPMTIPATGGTSELTTYATRTRVDTYTSTATKETEESSAPYTTISGTEFSLSASSAMNITITAEKNTGAQRTATITSKAYDVAETLTITQESGQTISSYGDITINGGNATDIPASGGTVKASGCTANIQVTYSSGQTGSVTVPIENITYTEVSAESLGTTVKARTKVGTSTCNVSYQGKSATKNFDVYQQANTRSTDDIDYGAWQVSVSANPTTIAAGGGTSTITRSASRTRTQNYSYTSGATSQASLSDESGTPTLSITGSGFSLNGTTITASSNVPAKNYTLSVTNPSAELEDGPAHNLSSTVTSTYSIAGTNSRNCTVTANMNGTVKTCTVTQSGNTASSGNQDWSVAKGTGLNSATKSSSTVVMTPEPKYGNKNETFTGQCTVTQTGSNKTATATGTWYKGYLNVSPTSLQFDANGGTKTVEIDTNLYWEIVPA